MTNRVAANSTLLRYAVKDVRVEAEGLAVHLDKLKLRIIVSPQVIFQKVQLGESLLLDVKSLRYFAFDSLGTRLWSALQESPDADEALQLAAAGSDMPLPELRSKFRAILGGLERSGLIKLERF